MKKKVLLFSLLLICASALLIQSIYSNQPQDIEIHLIVKGRNTDFWKSVAAGANDAAKDQSGENKIKVKVSGPTLEEDYRNQRESLAKSIEKNPDMIILAPGNATGLNDLMYKAQEKKIPLLLMDSLAANKDWLAYVGSDNYKIGEEVALEVAKRQSNPKILLVNFVKNAPAAIAREKGFVETAHNKGLTINKIIYCDSNEHLALQQVKDSLLKDKTINTVIGLNAQSTIGAAKAVIECDEKHFLVGGVDGTLVQSELIAENQLDFTVVQNPYQIGYFSVENAIRYLSTGKISEETIIDNEVIDQSNMYENKNQELIFPFE